MVPVTFEMSDLNANEKKVGLPQGLPTQLVRPGTIRTGDVLLWGDDTLVVFYKTFSSLVPLHAHRPHREPGRSAEGAGAGRRARDVHAALKERPPRGVNRAGCGRLPRRRRQVPRRR